MALLSFCLLNFPGQVVKTIWRLMNFCVILKDFPHLTPILRSAPVLGLNCVPSQKDMLWSWLLVLQQVTLFGNRVFTEVIKLRWGQYDWFLIKWGNLDTKTNVEFHVQMKTEIRWCFYKECQRLPANQEITAGRRGKGQVISHGPRRNQPCCCLDVKLLASRTVQLYISTI